MSFFLPRYHADHNLSIMVDLCVVDLLLQIVEKHIEVCAFICMCVRIVSMSMWRLFEGFACKDVACFSIVMSHPTSCLYITLEELLNCPVTKKVSQNSPCRTKHLFQIWVQRCSPRNSSGQAFPQCWHQMGSGVRMFTVPTFPKSLHLAANMHTEDN